MFRNARILMGLSLALVTPSLAQAVEPAPGEVAGNVASYLAAPAQSSLLVYDQPFQDNVELDKDKIRYGKASDFDPKKKHKVGTIRSKDIYLEIPAYQTIIKEKISKDSARWRILMEEATKVYKKAVKKVAKDGSFVLVVEEGGISGYTTTDLTNLVIEAVEGQGDDE